MNKPDVLAIIDSKSKPAQIVSEVLLGATSAPIYFEIPYKIGTQNYIDGAVTGTIKWRLLSWNELEISNFVKPFYLIKIQNKKWLFSSII